MVDMTKTTPEKKLTPGDIRGVFLRSNLFQGSWNFERMQALGFCFLHGTGDQTPVSGKQRSTSPGD
ncbi:PTS system mannose-specific transporter subunit IID [Lelliottia amnigena]|nr:PTS system mannose-specific transporter subunit IID [Lelliottia amnigena]